MGGGCWLGGMEMVSRSSLLGDIWLIDAISAELAVGWFGNYDSYDLASLVVLAHGPTVSQRMLGEYEDKDES